jgi:hypothetical protein
MCLNIWRCHGYGTPLQEHRGCDFPGRCMTTQLGDLHPSYYLQLCQLRYNLHRLCRSDPKSSTSSSLSPIWPNIAELCRTALRKKIPALATINTNHDFTIAVETLQIDMLSSAQVLCNRHASIGTHCATCNAHRVVPWNPSCVRCRTLLRPCDLVLDREDCIPSPVADGWCASGRICECESANGNYLQ